MHYNRHYIIYLFDKQNIDRILADEYKINVAVEFSPYTNLYDMVFDIPENHPQFDELEKLLSPENLPCDKVMGKYKESRMILYSAIYSEKERLSAEWLEIASSFMRVQEFSESYRGECFKLEHTDGFKEYYHSIFEGPFVASGIKWRQKFFASTETDQELLFCSEDAKNILTQNNIVGIEYDPVFKKSGEQREDIYRIGSKHIIPEEAIVGLENTINLNCPVCGMKMITLEECSRYGIKGGILDKNIDFYNTMPMIAHSIASGIRDLRGDVKTIISQRLYRIIKENKMDRALIFTPLETV